MQQVVAQQHKVQCLWSSMWRGIPSGLQAILATNVIGLLQRPVKALCKNPKQSKQSLKMNAKARELPRLRLIMMCGQLHIKLPSNKIMSDTWLSTRITRSFARLCVHRHKKVYKFKQNKVQNQASQQQHPWREAAASCLDKSITTIPV